MMIENGMSAVTVKKSELLETLKKNREQHANDYKETRAAYEVAFVDELKKMLNKAVEKTEFVRTVDLVEPENHTREYDRNIRMLTMSVSETVVISEHEFSQFVLDEWNWKDRFTGTSEFYKNRR